MTTFSVALWATNLTPRLNGIGAWLAAVDEKMHEAKVGGADLLVMPEYACVQWVSFAPAGIATRAEAAWMAGQVDAALAGLRALVARHGIALLAGSMPVKAAERMDGRLANRAYLLLPDGREVAQDKLCPTPSESDEQDWHIAGGDRVQVVEWRGLRLATAICLDIELPALGALLSGLDLDIILVPAMTETLAGYHRVFDCAKARAVETQAAVCAVGTIGATPYLEKPETNVSGAAVYIPCEDALGATGTLASLPPRDGATDDGPLLILRDLPIDELRRMRAGAARVWRGAWSAAHVRVDDPRVR